MTDDRPRIVMMAGPGMKVSRYDRQQRLWGWPGQARLEKAHATILGSGVVACEIARCLILPGLRKVTLVDHVIGKIEDIKKNYFVRSVGIPRVTSARLWLSELNRDVEIEAKPQSIQSFLEDPNATFGDLLIFASDTALEQLPTPQLVSELCEKRNCSFTFVRTFRSLGMLYLWSPPLAYIDSDTAEARRLSQLCLENPFPELLSFTASDDPTPFPLLLLKARSLFTQKNEGRLPSDDTDLEEIKKILKDTSEEVTEALRHAHLVVSKKNEIPALHSLAEGAFLREHPAWTIFLHEQKEEDSLASQFSRDCFCFSLGLMGVARFKIKNRRFPALPKLPDMTASTSTFQKLNKIYENQFKKDCNEVAAILDEFVSQRLSTMGVRCSEGDESHELSALNLLKTKFELPPSWPEELVAGSGVEFKDFGPARCPWYELPEAAVSCGAPRIPLDDFSQGGGSGVFHSTAVLMGALTAQEVLKLSTRRFKTLNGVLFWDGLCGHLIDNISQA